MSLRGLRYAVDIPPAILDMVEGMRWRSHDVAEATYQAIFSQPGRRTADKHIALLACNDRYFLMTRLLGRADLRHKWLYERCREVEREPDGCLDLWAREHYKSSIITQGGVIQEVLCDPEITIGIFGNKVDISRPFLAKIKQEFEYNSLLLRYFPDVLWTNPSSEAPSWSLERGITVKRAGSMPEATIEAHGLLAGMPTGRHFKLLVYDDVITEKNVSSPDQIKKATEMLELSYNLGSGDIARMWHIGTRYHFGDTYGQLLENKALKPRVYPATDDGTLKGKPVLLSPAAWQDRQQKRRSTLAAQFLQNPLAGQANMFRVDRLVSYELRPRLMNIYIMVDPSLGKSASSDRTAIAVVAVDPGFNYYLIDGYCHRMRLSDRWRLVRDLYKKWSKAEGVRLCDVGYERYGQQTDLETFEMEMRREGSSFAIRELNWVRDGEQSKPKRVERLEPLFRNSRFYLPAKVYSPEAGNVDKELVALWSVKEGAAKLDLRPYHGHQRQEINAIASGERYRLMEPLKRRDEDGNIYDLTRVFVEEYSFFPYSPRDDLIDAVSRVIDMEPVAPTATFQQIHDTLYRPPLDA